MYNSFNGFLFHCCIQAAKDLTDSTEDPPAEISLYAVLFVTVAAAFVVRVLMLVFGVKAFSFFGKGLKEKGKVYCFLAYDLWLYFINNIRVCSRRPMKCALSFKPCLRGKG